MFCDQVKEFLSQKQIPFQNRDITKDPSAISELRKLGYMTTPVTIIDGKVVVGFDEPKLGEALNDGKP